jgi:hypothetical protein
MSDAFKEIPRLNTRDDKLVARCLNDLYLGEVKVMSPSKAGNSNVFSCAIAMLVYMISTHRFWTYTASPLKSPPWEYT